MSTCFITPDQGSIYESVRGTVLVMKYSREENIPLNLIDEVSSKKSISFTVFLTIRTDRNYDNEVVLTLSRFTQKRESVIELKRFSLNPLQNTSGNTSQSESEKKRLPFDTMKVEQNIRINCQDVPTIGEGDYAISLRLLFEDGDFKNSKLIDAFYFSVIE